MPETRIGLFVDVGSAFHLSKLPFGLSIAIGVFGDRIKG